MEFHGLAENTNVRWELLKESPKQKINGLAPHVAPLRNFGDPSLCPKGTKRRRLRGVTCGIMRVLPAFPVQKVHKLGRILLPSGIYRYRYRCISKGTHGVIWNRSLNRKIKNKISLISHLFLRLLLLRFVSWETEVPGYCRLSEDLNMSILVKHFSMI